MELLIESNRGYLKFKGRFGLLVKGVKERIFLNFQKFGATSQLFNCRARIETVKFSIHKLCQKFLAVLTLTLQTLRSPNMQQP